MEHVQITPARPADRPRLAGLGADVCLHAVSSSAEWTPASDKSVCPLSVSLRGNFASSAQRRQCVNFASCVLLMKVEKRYLSHLPLQRASTEEAL